MKKLSKFYYTDNCHVADFVEREQVGCAAVYIAWLLNSLSFYRIFFDKV